LFVHAFIHSFIHSFPGPTPGRLEELRQESEIQTANLREKLMGALASAGVSARDTTSY
jgi:hypothetical protein